MKTCDFSFHTLSHSLPRIARLLCITIAAAAFPLGPAAAADADNPPADSAAAETAPEAVEETVQEAAEETSQEAVEETSQEAVEETSQEAVEETVQEAVDETAHEAVDETAQEAVDETAHEAVDETAQEAVDETVQEAVATDSPAGDSAQPRTLSVAPLSQVIYPDDRPAWVDASPQIGEEVEVWPVTSLLRPTAEEARESLRLQMRGAVFAHAEQFLGAERVKHMPLHQLLPVIELLPEDDRYAGTATLGDHTVYEEAVRLRFDESYRRQLASTWRESEVRRRLVLLGLAGGGTFCLLLPATGVVRRIARRRSESTQ